MYSNQKKISAQSLLRGQDSYLNIDKSDERWKMNVLKNKKISMWKKTNAKVKSKKKWQDPDFEENILDWNNLLFGEIAGKTDAVLPGSEVAASGPSITSMGVE